MSTTPCLHDAVFEAKAEAIAAVLKEKAHEIAALGLTEEQFYGDGYFRLAIDKIRGQTAAELKPKRRFMRAILNHMMDEKAIKSYDHAENDDRHDYPITLNDGRIAIVEQKGCPDGNNINISERPPHADEFYIWLLCTSRGSNVPKGMRSGINRILSDMIATGKRVDGIIMWDMVCGGTGRICPKIANNAARTTKIAEYTLPPPCIFTLPATISHPRLNPKPQVRELASLGFAKALSETFKGQVIEVSQVEYETQMAGASTQKRFRILRNGVEVEASQRWNIVKRVTS